ncbi:hypothetical protein [Sedimentitalea todarodis]|uniref:Alpha/beta hydrolase n=1 Tax=Sedimentitalea todarodis TaxID=1631240 RepID=A0ABU3VLN8_9RHOB|nr:hypothetical protein [Sedimentitalea todarodis]MDU9006880.1 hypothetical protein [Sedimentitalea todarodis]
MRNVFGKKSIIFLLLVAVFAFHRTPNVAHRAIPDDCLMLKPIEDCGTLEEVGSATLAYVEFDDQGSYYDQRQALVAYEKIRRVLEESEGNTELFVFVHGWQNNASQGNSNVSAFKSFLAARSKENTERQTIGVYVGWPGETLKFPLSLLTFWSRQAAADRVAEGSVQEFFATIKQIQADRLAEFGADEKFRIFTIGHSFGGLIAFQANSSAYAVKYGANHPYNRYNPVVDGLGDVLVLINPAIEAERFSVLHSLSTEYPKYPFYSPNLVAVGSETDWATKIMFPMGVVPTAIFSSQLRGDQWIDAFTTVTNSKSYLTHYASVREEGVYVCEQDHGPSQRSVPFWFVEADRNLIDGHSDLDGEKLLWLFRSIQLHIREKKYGGLERCPDLH